MDNGKSKVLNEVTSIATQGKIHIGDRLSMERAKAIEILQKAKGKTKCVSLSGAHCSKANKENMNENYRTKMDKIDVPSRYDANSINISDLVTDETINLERTANNMRSPHRVDEQKRSESGILFQPEEISGRSTLCNGGSRHRPVSPRRFSTIKTSKDVEELLATSFMPEVRAMVKSNESKPGTDPMLTHTLLSSTVSTTGCSRSHSLPRTADMSQISEKSALGRSSMFSFTDAAAVSNDSAFSSEEFAAGELMQAKLLKDEISWANNYAAIPARAVSTTNTGKVGRGSNMSIALSSVSLIDGDPDFSVGSYFNKRSDNIWDIVDGKSPQKSGATQSLARSASAKKSHPVSRNSVPDIENTPKVDNKTYSLAMERESSYDIHESEDSGNSSRNSYLLSISAIDRALHDMHFSTDVSEDNIIRKLKGTGKVKSAYGKKNATQQPIIAELISENKENLDPKAMRSAVQFCDTLSFTESLLNCSELKTVSRSSISNPRSPLSPIDIKIIPASGSDTNVEGDVDDWPSPIKTQQRQIRRNKSPVHCHHNKSSPPKSVFVSTCLGSKSPRQDSCKERSLSPACNHNRMSHESSVSHNNNRNSTKERSLSPACNHNRMSLDPSVSQSSNRMSTKERSLSPACNHNRMSHDPSVSQMTNNRMSIPSPDYQQKSPNISGRNMYTEHNKVEQQRTPINERSTPQISIKYSPLNVSDAVDRTLTSSNSMVKSTTTTLKSPQLEHNVCQSRQSPGHARNRSVSASPTSESFRSPKLNSTNNSDRRAIMNGAVCSTTCSSPVNSEVSVAQFGNSVDSGGSVRSYPSYGIPPTRTSSTVSINDGAMMRCTSRCSNSSEFSHRDGKILPLKVTEIELSWGSTKLRANSRKSVQVKNTSDKRLVLRISISGPGFSLLNLQSSTLAFQSQECRTITVNFSPTITGAAVGALSFYSPLNVNNSNGPYMQLPLYGYGGNALFQLLNVAKGPVGTAFLTMGENLAELSHPLARTIKIYNRGPLLGFALVTIDSSGLHGPRLCDAFEVKPAQMLIQPGDTATVSITFRPKRDDIKKITKKIRAVYTLANMRVIVGDEANRQRIRRLVQRMSTEERGKLTSSSFDSLWMRFPSEYELREINDFIKEPTRAASDLMTGAAVHEIALTLNHHESPDNTMESTVSSAFCCFPDGDETVLFRTVCAASASPTPTINHRVGVADNKLYPVSELHEATVSSTTTSHSHEDITDEGDWSVQPTKLAYDFFADRRAEQISLLVRNTFRSQQYFEVTCSHAHLLRFTPSEGCIQPDGGQVEIKVHALQSRPPINLKKNESIYIEVSMENERIRVPVILPKDNYACSHLRSTCES